MKRKDFLKSLIFLYAVLYLLSCSQSKTASKIGLFDISKDDTQILFTWYNNNSSSIWRIDTNGKTLKLFISETVDTNYFNPRFNRDGKKILFIANQINDLLNSCIYIANVDGTEKKKIVYGQGLITEAFFSECEDKIYFIKSKEFGHSSPLGKSQPHGSDIYSVHLDDGKIEQITNRNAYGMYRVAEYDCNSLIMDLPPTEGMIKILKNDPDHFISINPLNNPRQDSTLYDSPFYSKQYNVLIFLAPYEMYLMNMNTRQARFVARDENMISNFRLFNKQTRIVYTNDSDNDFFVINFNGTGLKKIPVPIAVD